MSFVPDITTAKGRKEIAYLAYKVAQTKTYLDGLGKDLVAELKEIPKLIDANRKTV
ncbi:cell envelope biogenesis protein TolA, partial [Escherichia coli]|nr:cell envelope biogenesis protein TolA [Escherichia coli]EGT6614443.1 cell envelope biogenesis protein TolA [Escherichia coli]